MIKTFVARAIQISVLEKDQIEQLHGLERNLKHLLMNWNIQEFFHLPLLSERFEIPPESLEQIKHHERIGGEINQLNLKTTAENYEEKLDWYHAFDWNIYHQKGNIVWEYSGSGKKGNLKERLRD